MGPHIEDCNLVGALLRLREFLRDELDDGGLTSTPSTFEADGLATTLGLNHFCDRAGNPLMASKCVCFGGGIGEKSGWATFFHSYNSSPIGR